MHRRVREIAENIAAAFSARADVTIHIGYDPTINTVAEVELAAAVARDIVGEQHVLTDIPPTMGAEDFGALLQQRPGAYIAVGQATGDKKSPHNFGLHIHFTILMTKSCQSAPVICARLVETFLKQKLTNFANYGIRLYP